MSTVDSGSSSLSPANPYADQLSPPRSAASRAEVFHGMHRVDTSGNPRIPILMDMVGALSRADDPIAVWGAFADGLSRIFGPTGYISLSVRGLKPGEYKVTRFAPDFSVPPTRDHNPWRDWNSLPTHTGGFFGEIIRDASPKLIHQFHLRGDPVFGDALAGFGSMLAIPLFENGQPLNWSISLHPDPQGISVQAMEDTILRNNLGGATIRNVIIQRQLREANARNQREIAQIARIQRTLLPQEFPKFPGVSIAASYETFDVAGGDMYDLAVIPEHMHDEHGEPEEGLAMMIADASGHGPAAAVVSAMLNAILYAPPPGAESPGTVLRFANQHLAAKRLEAMFVTAFLAGYHPHSRTLLYSNAGHNPPLLKNPGSGGSVRRLDNVGNVPLGVLDDVDYEVGSIKMLPAQTLVMYTDGIIEAMNPKREMFGLEGIERALAQCSGEADCVINSITTALREHEAGVRPGDDQTLVAIRFD